MELSLLLQGMFTLLPPDANMLLFAFFVCVMPASDAGCLKLLLF